MDTRAKILTPEQCFEERANWGAHRIVTGYFDPMLAWHALRLADLTTEETVLVVALVDPPEPLLDSRSRAELVAGLACVDRVVLPMANGSAAMRGDITEEAAHLERRTQLLAHVHTRHNR